MGSSRSRAMSSVDPVQTAAADAAQSGELPSGTSHPHDFEVQKQLHQQIRNDPDYDDWEYGTEPLPHEAWVAKVSRDGGSAAQAAG